MKALKVERHLTRAELGALYHGTKDPRLMVRYLAILLLYDGESTYEAGATVGKSPQVVRQWVHRWNEGGPEALKEKERSGRPPFLTPEQQQELAEHVTARPNEGGHDFNVWYLKNIAGYVAQEYGKEYSVSGIHRWRKRAGLAYRVPRVEPLGCD